MKMKTFTLVYVCECGCEASGAISYTVCNVQNAIVACADDHPDYKIIAAFEGEHQNLL